MADSIVSTEIITVTETGASSQRDQLAVEEPLEIRLQSYREGVIQRQSIAITMRTPGHDRELAMGFLAGEGIISNMSEISSCEHTGTEVLKGNTSNVINVGLQPHVEVDLERLKRHFYTSSSCGVCGKASLEALEVIGAEAMIGDDFRISHHSLHKLTEKLRGDQHLFLETGGLHAAALFDHNGTPLCLREDVGRHNAMDKVCGYQLENSGPMAGVFVSGRASFELMQKALMARLPILAAVGAPSSLAVAFAEEYNMTLVGFMRDGRFNIYTGEDRIQLP
jgi:FdhD protein